MAISHFASLVNHPICQYMQTFPISKANTAKSKIHFLSGDPTAYGNLDFKMPQEGYEILRRNIINPENHGYTLSSGVPSARQAVLKLYHPKTPLNINDVIIQHNVNQGLMIAIMAFTNPGDQILVPETGYPIFQKLGPALGVKVVHYKLRHDKNYEIDLQNLPKLISQKTQFIFIINPSNPMGTIFTKQHMQDILKVCDQNQLPIVSDEVYHGQAFEGVHFYSFGDITQNVPVLVLSGVEKVLSVPGWSTSWTVLFDKNNYLEQIWRNIQTTGMTFLHSNKYSQLALSEILDKVGLFNIKPIQKTKLIHDKLYSSFKSMKGYTPIPAQGTFYLTVLLDLAQFKDFKSDKEYVQKILQEQNIAFIPLSVFGGPNQGIRLLTCADVQVYDELLVRMKAFNTKHQQ